MLTPSQDTRWSTKDVARLCHSQGWRDKNLITIVAIVAAETNNKPDFNDGTRYGLFGLQPHQVTTGEDLLTPEACATIARERYEKRFFAIWISYATGKYYDFVEEAIKGVSELYLDFFKAELV